MKKHILLTLLLCVAFPLCAQSNNASIFILPVTGTGSKPADNGFFYDKLVTEIADLRFNIAKSLPNSEFYLIGTLASQPDDPNKPDVKQYVFRLTLLNSKTNESSADGELVYENLDNINDQFMLLLYSVLNTIPASAGKNNWRNKRLFVGGAASWTPRIYTSEGTAMHLASFGGGVFAEYHFLDFAAVEAGLELASDLIRIYPDDEEHYKNTLMEIPLLLKFVLKPGDFSVFEPYAGIHLNIPFSKTTEPPLLAWMVGFQYGVKAGPGILFINPRFSMDVGKSRMETDPATTGLSELFFQRDIIHLSIGYKVGFLTRR